MIRLFASLIQAFLFDENAARRWLRGTISLLALSGGIYADQAASVFPERYAHDAAAIIRFAAFVCAFGVAAHDAKKKGKLGRVVEMPKP